MKAFSAEETSALLNEWMRRYIENPEDFNKEFQAVGLFLAETAAGQTPTYGDRCAAYMDYLRKDVAAKAQAAANVVALEPRRNGRRKRAA